MLDINRQYAIRFFNSLQLPVKTIFSLNLIYKNVLGRTLNNIYLKLTFCCCCSCDRIKIAAMNSGEILNLQQLRMWPICSRVL